MGELAAEYFERSHGRQGLLPVAGPGFELGQGRGCLQSVRTWRAGDRLEIVQPTGVRMPGLGGHALRLPQLGIGQQGFACGQHHSPEQALVALEHPLTSLQDSLHGL